MKMKVQPLFLSAALLASAAVQAQPQPTNIYQKYQTQAAAIYQHMTLDEKIGQLLLPAYQLLANSVSPGAKLCQAAVQGHYPTPQMIKDCGLDQIAQYHIGAVLTGGGPYYNAPTLADWAALNQLASKIHNAASPYDPLLLTGNDAIHGNMHLQGAVMFPHNIGLGVTHDPKLVYRIGDLVGKDSIASGFNWVYMPTIAVAQDLRWGRTYESFSQDPAIVKEMAKAYVGGFQHIKGNKLTGPVATAKHFIGDGATQYGFDEGDDNYQGSEADFWKENGPGYEGAEQANVGTVMVSYSAIDGDNTRMHFGGKWNILNQFIHQGIVGTDGRTYALGGFTVSDWNGPTRAAYFYDQANDVTLTLPQIMANTINNGVDMIMLGPGDVTDPFDPNSKPNFTNVGEVFNAIKTAYQKGMIDNARLQDAVTRILGVKLAMSPRFEGNYEKLQAKERKLALKASEESFVLLKNNQHTLPLKAHKIKNVVFVGDVNDLGIQNGGWTVNWQGQKGDEYFTGADKISSGATTLEEGIKHALKNRAVNYYYVNKQSDALPAHINSKNTVVIALVAEVPYAEFMGDIGNTHTPDKWYDVGAANQYNFYLGLPQSQDLSLKFNANEASAIQTLKEKGIKVVTVVYSGRPIILSEGGSAAPLPNSDAVIAAFLPGTLGGKALAKTIFGGYHFRSAAHGASNTLTFPWPRNMQDVSSHFADGSLFPMGYGLRD
jgi:beta-glucosidase